MPLSIREYERLQKLMEMTASDNDNELIQAMRAANKLLNQHGYTWRAVFRRVVRVVQEFEPDDGEPAPDRFRREDDEEIANAFRVALDDTRPGSFRDTLLSIQAKYETTGRLTERQREVVMDAAHRAGER
jgi:hypothetical protein